MTEAQRDKLLDRLTRRLSIDADDSDTVALLLEELEDAEAELLLYLNRDTLPDALLIKASALAAVSYQRDKQAMDGDCVKSSSYSEGEQSQSATYLTPEDYQGQIDRLLNDVARYRLVSVKKAVTPDETP